MNPPSFRLDGQVALVTGSGSGIGQGAAWALAHAGADVVVTDLPRFRDRAARTAEDIARETGRRAIALDLDVTKIPSIHDVVDGTVATLGRLDVLVNSAGVNRAKPAFEVTEEDWDFVLDVNLKGLFFACQAAARAMARRDGGAIINLASINGVVGFPKRAAYCASKGGVVNLTRELAIEFASSKIRVNAVGPTYTETPLAEPTIGDPDTRREILQRTPMGRIGKVDEIVGAIVFLASPAASLITGHTLLVDGGWTAW